MGGAKLGIEALRQINALIRKDRLRNRPPPPTRRQQHTSFGGSGVIAYNSSGSTIPAWGIMRIVAATTLSDELVYEVGQANSTFERFYLVNGEDTILNGSYGTGYFLDIAGRALYDSADGTPAAGEVWGPYPSSWKLRKHAYGFEIIGDADTNDTHVRCVQERANGVLLAKADATISADASGTFSIYTGNRADTGFNLSAYCHTAITSTSAYMFIERIANTWYATPAECQ